jgi:hypothetical protein
MAHGPTAVVEVQVTHTSKIAVSRGDGEPLELLDTAAA